MSGYLEIQSSGFQSSIQDKGRWRFQEYGIPLCGSVVPHWMELGNNLVGNKADAPGIEFRVLGPTLQAFDAPVKLAICGDVTAEVISESESGTHSRKVPGWRSFTLNPDEKLKIGSLENSVAGFLAISGGVQADPVMGSVSTYIRSEIGGLNGHLLQVGDRIEITKEAVKQACEADKVQPSPPTVETGPIRVVLGPQEDYFDQTSIDQFLNFEYLVSKESDRMGARLEGPTLKHKEDKGSEIISDGVVPGTIQVPGNGQPIVLLNDGQTVGGYPKIATVISSDLHRVANALPGTQLKFEAISAQEACLIAREAKLALDRMKSLIVAASANGFVNLKALYETNLIGGVVDMAKPDHFPGSLQDEDE
ncbi:biotin-dependent carboxyltransferase family protein [Terasakiella sp. A23]|uniref:5-oxoprolinase subunit C family protein n=1 Tax=Terasakiella sp. FCG-A23 TaxID=3080561 RepID=UPI0029538307|nr:biotin-dependent carboxyltransferase family protein [Terasakiella sp. A23]MDV7339171.1 biotin-dependent carboxyltransferase family protein [Terasakiella sp. A23]